MSAVISVPPATGPVPTSAAAPKSKSTAAWSIRLLNSILWGIEKVGLYKIGVYPDTLMKEVRYETGRDFQDQSFVEPFRVLAKSVMEEAGLHPVGRFMVLAGCKAFLKNRISLEAAWQANPEALAVPVRRPLYVIGLPRTGTTLLYNLLCQDPAARPLMGWESFFPVPLADRRGPRPDGRRQRASGIITRMHRMAPKLKAVHEIVSEGPEECTWILHNSYLSSSQLLQARMPAYAEYLHAQPRDVWRRVYTEYANALKILQHGTDKAHWVLKSPAHQLGLAGLMDVIPNACIVQTHRDVGKVIGSCCSLFSVVRHLYSDDVRHNSLGTELVDHLQLCAERAMAARNERPDQVFDVRFEELVKQPIETVRKIYDRFGYPFDPRMEAGMQRWLAENPQGKHGAHKYELSEFGLTDEYVRNAFADYQQQVETITQANR